MTNANELNMVAEQIARNFIARDVINKNSKKLEYKALRALSNYTLNNQSLSLVNLVIDKLNGKYITKIMTWLDILCGNYASTMEKEGILQIKQNADSIFFLDKENHAHFSLPDMASSHKETRANAWQSLIPKAQALQSVKLETIRLVKPDSNDIARDHINALAKTVKGWAHNHAKWDKSASAIKLARCIEALQELYTEFGIECISEKDFAPVATTARHDGSPVINAQ